MTHKAWKLEVDRLCSIPPKQAAKRLRQVCEEAIAMGIAYFLDQCTDGGHDIRVNQDLLRPVLRRTLSAMERCGVPERNQSGEIILDEYNITGGFSHEAPWPDRGLPTAADVRGIMKPDAERAALTRHPREGP